MVAPLISIVVGAFDMKRELPRTLLSLSPPYQRGIAAQDVEIIVADNGSSEPVQPGWFEHVPCAVRVMRFDGLGVSPVIALNAAAKTARGRVLVMVIDGARLASPGFLALGLRALRLDDEVFATTLGMHLGPTTQQISITAGYDRDREDQLLADIGWPADGYRLFEISAAGESARHGALSPQIESNLFMVQNSTYDRLGGYREAFQLLGGGYANLELYDRFSSDGEVLTVLMLGEASFHQLHYGATTQPGGIRRVASPEGLTLAQLYEAERRQMTDNIVQEPEAPFLFGRPIGERAIKVFFPK